MALGDWEQALEVASRCTRTDPHCADALAIDIVHRLARGGQGQEVQSCGL